MNSSGSNKVNTSRNIPVLIAVITGVAGLLGTGVGALIQGFNETKLEQQKFESNLIFKALEPKDPEARVKYLIFLLDAGLVKSLNVEKIRSLAKDPTRIPRSVPDLNMDSSADFVGSEEAAPGSIEVTTPGKWNSWGSGDSVYATSREYNDGRVLAFGHDDILGISDNNRDILKKSFEWLSGSSNTDMILFSSGHCEWVPVKYPSKAQKLFTALEGWGYKTKSLPGTITKEQLKGASVLVIGNAWGDLTSSEIVVIENFVSNGGGLLAAGLGWSWINYSAEDGFICVGKNQNQDIKDLSTYPMNRIVGPYGIRWTSEAVQK